MNPASSLNVLPNVAPDVGSKSNTTTDSKKTYLCTYCKKAGHLINRCYKFHGFPDESKPPKLRVAANASKELGESSSQSLVLGLSPYQYVQLLHLL